MNESTVSSTAFPVLMVMTEDILGFPSHVFSFISSLRMPESTVTSSVTDIPQEVSANVISKSFGINIVFGFTICVVFVVNCY